MFRIMSAATTAALALAAPSFAQEVPEPDPETEAALNQTNVMTVRNVDRTELPRDTPVYDAAGKPVGKVLRFAGNDVVIVDAGREYLVPITEFFAYNQYGKDYFAIRTPKATLARH